MSPTSILPWHRPCPVCGSDPSLALHRNVMAPIGDLDMSYEVCRCRTCGFHYAARLPRPETYSCYYQRLSKYDCPATDNSVSPLDQRRTDATLALCAPHLTPTAVVADIGCGAGALLRAFRYAGYTRLMGLDPAPSAAAALGLADVRAGFFHEAPEQLPLHEADLICVTGVLEHLPRLREDMGNVLAALADGAKVLIEVPALEHFAHPTAEPFGEFSLEHIQYFSRESLKNFMGSFGFTPVASTIVSLDGAADSLFGLFIRGEPAPSRHESSAPVMDAYLTQSRQSLVSALARIRSASQGPFIIYGAGSHTARLLPALEEIGLLQQVAGIVDGNPNLQGQSLAGHVIAAPQSLAQEPDMAVLVSSHKGQEAIARALRQQNGRRPVILLYA